MMKSYVDRLHPSLLAERLRRHPTTILSHTRSTHKSPKETQHQDN